MLAFNPLRMSGHPAEVIVLSPDATLSAAHISALHPYLVTRFVTRFFYVCKLVATPQSAVLAYRVFADTQRVRNVLATKAFGHRFEYIDFARSECRRDDFICCWMLSIEMVGRRWDTKSLPMG